MALLKILTYPDARLRTKAKPVKVVDARVKQLVDDMFETMYEAPGIGLAATQVDVHERIVVMDISEEKDDPLVVINGKITHKEGSEQMQEGCLSVPGAFETVKRAERITLEALDREGEPYTLEAEGLLAVCIQHELDHLEGKLFVDRLSSLKRQRVRKKLESKRRDSKRPAQDASAAI